MVLQGQRTEPEFVLGVEKTKNIRVILNTKWLTKKNQGEDSCYCHQYTVKRLGRKPRRQNRK